MKAPDFDILEQKGRRDDGTRNAALGGAESAERGAGQIICRILHVSVNRRVIANPEDIAEGPQSKSFDHASTHRFLMSIGYEDTGYGERHTFAAGNSAGDLANKIGKVLLVDGRDRGIGHSFHFEAPFVTILAASIEKFFPQIVRLQGL